jgi:DNA-binding transcriptional regulator YiaG
MNKKYQSEALMVSHQSAERLHRLGIINDSEMKEITEMCFVEEEKTEAVGDIATVETA